MSFPIVPAVIPESAEAVKRFAGELSFSPEFHLDVVDGVFVRTVSWPYEPIGSPREVGKVLESYTLEVDLMVADPIQAGAQWVEAGADILVFHIETVPIESFERFARQSNVSISICCHGATPLSELEPFLPYADGIQVMGIYEIGAQGIPFYEPVLEQIAYLKKAYPHYPITVDGSVNQETIVKLRDAGADRFIVGSGIVKQANPQEAYQSLYALVNQ